MNMPKLVKSLILQKFFTRTLKVRVNKMVDVATHTGQKWDTTDYRLVRFTNAGKHVNKNWSVNLISEIPPREVPCRVVWCDGGNGAEGHPKIYINLDKPGPNTCGYCGLRFVKVECH